MTTTETFEFKTVLHGVTLFVEAKTSMDTNIPEEYQIDYLNIYVGDARITNLIDQCYYDALEAEAYAYIDSFRNSREDS
jgi:hypothetical protein